MRPARLLEEWRQGKATDWDTNRCLDSLRLTEGVQSRLRLALGVLRFGEELKTRGCCSEYAPTHPGQESEQLNRPIL